MKNLEIAILLDFYDETLTQKQRAITLHYYNDDLSLAEIAENEGISRQGVRDAVKRAETQLLEMEAMLGLLAKSRKTEAAMNEINELSAKISEYNLRYNGSIEIDNFAKRISSIISELRS